MEVSLSGEKQKVKDFACSHIDGLVSLVILLLIANATCHCRNVYQHLGVATSSVCKGNTSEGPSFKSWMTIEFSLVLNYYL